MMTSFLLWREEEERVTSHSGRGKSRRFLLGTGQMPHPVGGAMGVTASLP